MLSPRRGEAKVSDGNGDGDGMGGERAVLEGSGEARLEEEALRLL